MIRIAFTLIGGKNWTGGYNYLLNLLRVISAYRPSSIQPILFLGTDVDTEEARPFSSINGVEIVTNPALNADRRFATLLKSLMFGSDAAIRRLLHEHRIDVVFENAQFFGAQLGIPVLAWIPDFQHRELPHMFSRTAWWKRELGFRAQIAAGRTIMLSSFDAREACERYYPAAVGRTHVVRFAVASSRRIDPSVVREVRETYGIPERYFYLPNQFWQHKNHLLVIDALEILKKAGHLITIVASGKQLDPYRPNYFQMIRARLQSTGAGDHFRLLGLIPYEHIAPLMVGSVAVLNPSLFEGWSTTVEEARALRVPMILSDLAVHKEQATGIAKFFDRTSAESLAATLLDAWQDGSSDPTSSVIVEDPLQRFADDIVDLINLVATQRPNSSKDTS